MGLWLTEVAACLAHLQARCSGVSDRLSGNTHPCAGGSDGLRDTTWQGGVQARDRASSVSRSLCPGRPVCEGPGAAPGPPGEGESSHATASTGGRCARGLWACRGGRQRQTVQPATARAPRQRRHGGRGRPWPGADAAPPGIREGVGSADQEQSVEVSAQRGPPPTSLRFPAVRWEVAPGLTLPSLPTPPALCLRQV